MSHCAPFMLMSEIIILFPFLRDPKVKRNFCRKCSTAFIPNLSCDIEVVQRPKEYSYVNCKCRTCGVTRNYILNSNHKLWESNPEFILEIYKDLQGKSGKSKMEIEVSDETTKGFESLVPSSSLSI